MKCSYQADLGCEVCHWSCCCCHCHGVRLGPCFIPQAAVGMVPVDARARLSNMGRGEARGWGVGKKVGEGDGEKGARPEIAGEQAEGIGRVGAGTRGQAAERGTDGGGTGSRGMLLVSSH